MASYHVEIANSATKDLRVIGPLDEKVASVDISLHGHPILRPWNANSPYPSEPLRRRPGRRVGVGGDVEVVFGDGRNVGDGQAFDRGLGARPVLARGVAVGLSLEPFALLLKVPLVLFGFLPGGFGLFRGGFGEGP